MDLWSFCLQLEWKYISFRLELFTFNLSVVYRKRNPNADRSHDDWSTGSKPKALLCWSKNPKRRAIQQINAVGIQTLERYLNVPPYNKSLQLSSDPKFLRSNQMLDAQIINLKRSGKENITHKPAIEKGHLKQLKTNDMFSCSSLLSLLRNVWFHVVLYFCRRGPEGQRQLKTTSFKFKIDAAGRKYASMTHDKVSKNHPGGLNDTSSSEKRHECTRREIRMMDIKLWSCTLTRWISGVLHFFNIQRWMRNHLGSTVLPTWWKKISEAAGLSKISTNHSIRATAITLWSNAGVDNRHIMSISGHRNEQSLAHYNSRPSVSQLHNCSDVLSRALSTENKSSNTASNGNQSSRTSGQQIITASTSAHEEATTPPIFHDCTFQNVQIVFNSSENRSLFKWRCRFFFFDTVWTRFCVHLTSKWQF